MAGEKLLLVFTNPAEGREDEFNKWYDDTHVPDVLKVPGVVAAQRYTLAEVELQEVEGAPAPPPPEHSYLAVYKISGDPNEVMTEFASRVANGSMPLSDVMDFASVGMSTWQPRGPEVEA